MKFIDFKELSKMFIDVIKYLLTAVIIYSFFSGLEKNMIFIYIMSVLLIIVLLALSVLFTYFDKRNKLLN
jgi:hypothetical protein